MGIPNMCLVLKSDNGKVVSIANGQTHRLTQPSSTVLVYRLLLKLFIRLEGFLGNAKKPSRMGASLRRCLHNAYRFRRDRQLCLQILDISILADGTTRSFLEEKKVLKDALEVLSQKLTSDSC